MNFSSPYEVITPTLEGPVLAAIAGTNNTMTRGQIVRVVEYASEAGVRKVLGRLVKQGIVREERTGGRYVYQMNHDHLAWPSIEGLLSVGELFKHRVGKAASAWAIQPISVAIFGSVAQGTADADSDIDVFIVSPTVTAGEQEKWDSQIDSLHDQIVSWTGNACDIVVMGPEELAGSAQRGEPILRSPMTTLAGRPIRDVLDKLRGNGVNSAKAMRG